MVSDQALPAGHVLRGRPDLIMLIGLIVTAWDDNESQMGRLFEFVSGLDTHTANAVYFSQINVRAKRAMIANPLEVAVISNKLKKEIRDILNSHSALTEARNRILHGKWVNWHQGPNDPDELKRQPLTPTLLETLKPKFKKKIYSKGDLIELFEDILSLNQRIHKIVHKRLGQRFEARMERSMKYGPEP